MEYEELINRIKEHEGYRNKVYLDSLGKRTVGYGHLCRADEKWDDDKQYDHKHLDKILTLLGQNKNLNNMLIKIADRGLNI